MKPTAVESDHREQYVRTRDDPFFAGMRRDEIASMKKGSVIGLQEKLARKQKFRSASDIGQRGSRNISINITEEEASLSPKDPPFDIVLEPIGRSSSGRWSKTSSPLVVVHSDVDTNFHDLNEPSTDCSLDSGEGREDQGGFMGPTIQSSHFVSTRQTDISDIPLPHSAAFFYNGSSQQMEVIRSCEGVYKLNMYLKARRAEVNAGVPGKFLHAVIGPDAAVGSVASTIMYAFYLYETLKNKQFCTVPVINMKRANLGSHADVHWLLDSCHIDLSSLIFIDEIDLSYYNLFGCLKLVLINCDKIPSEQEALKEAIVEVFHCTKDVSCCTVIAEKFANGSPEILAGQGFSRLLLAGIIMDSGNLSSSRCTSKDKYMATLLINGAGRFGFNGLHQILKYKTSSSSILKVKDILQKEFKKWTISGKPYTTSLGSQVPSIGMSSIGMSIAQLLTHDSASVQEIIHFQKVEALGLLLVVSGYYNSQKKFKREILISAESSQLMKNLLLFMNSSETHQLPLKAVHQSGLKDEMRVFEVDKVTSRRTIELLIEDYISASNSS